MKKVLTHESMEEKETFKDKLKGLLEAKSLVIIGLVIMTCWNFISDTFKEGADLKFNNRVTQVIKLNESYYVGLINKAIDSTMNDSFTFLDVLSSDHINKYVTHKSEEIKEHVGKEIMRQDSIKGSVVNELGEKTGYRNEDILPMLGELIKAYKEGKILTSRSVSASF